LAFDINELARNMLQGNKSNASLIPTENTNNYNNPISLLPSRPEFTPYQREEFDATVENGPGASLGWTWTKGVKSKQLWDDEQQAKADDAYKGYQTDLAAWTDAVNLWKTNQELQQQKLENQNAQLSALGLTPSAYAGDPSAQIRQLGSMYQSTSDPSLKAQYHKQALDLAKQAGWIQDGQVVDSVNSLPSMTMAGTPTFENQYKTDALNYEKEQDAYANALKAAKTQGGGSSGSSSGNTDSIYDDAIEEMLDGQSRHRQAILSGETRNPHSYNYYVNMAIQLANKSGKSLTQSQINALLQQASYLSKADEEWKASR
jgi:hypothetical protein